MHEASMTRTQSHTIAILNQLIETCKEGQEGFLAAASRIPDGDLKALLESYSRQRGQFVGELQEEVRRRGGDAESTGGAIGTRGRGWIDEAVAGDEERAIITECERGEDAALKNYQAAIAADLPEDVLARVQQHYTQICETHDLMRALGKAGTEERMP